MLRGLILSITTASNFNTSKLKPRIIKSRDVIIMAIIVAITIPIGVITTIITNTIIINCNQRGGQLLVDIKSGVGNCGSHRKR